MLVRAYLAKFVALQKIKGESATDLRNLYHCVRSTIGLLENIGRPIARSEDLFVHLTTELLDPRSRCEWENVISKMTESPSCSELQRFLERHITTLESIQPGKTDPNSGKASTTLARQTRSHHSKSQESKRGHCSLCSKDHYSGTCDVYHAKPATERKQHVEAQNLCYNCLGKHKLTDCTSKWTCFTCKARHHSTLHDACQGNEVATTTYCSYDRHRNATAVLLATARVRVTDRFSVSHTARALVDRGSESSLVSEDLAQRLRLPRTPVAVTSASVAPRLEAHTARSLSTCPLTKEAFR